jgi:hypothetical protein
MESLGSKGEDSSHRNSESSPVRSAGLVFLEAIRPARDDRSQRLPVKAVLAVKSRMFSIVSYGTNPSLRHYPALRTELLSLRPGRAKSSRGALVLRSPSNIPLNRNPAKNNSRCKRNRAFGEFQEVTGSGSVRSNDTRRRRSVRRSNRHSGRRSGSAGSPIRTPRPSHLAVGLSANMRRRPKARSTNVGQSSLQYGRARRQFRNSIASLTTRSSILRNAVAGTVTSQPPRIRLRKTSNGVHAIPLTKAFHGVSNSCSTTNSSPPARTTCKPTCIANDGPKADCLSPAKRRSNICIGRINQAPMRLWLSLWKITPRSSTTRPGGRLGSRRGQLTVSRVFVLGESGTASFGPN